VSIVMGLDQHRAQISAEWLETSTGEISRARIVPADRAGVRKFLAPFKGQGLEVALEATTGWRFVVEELERVGAEAHLAEPAEAAALKGNKKRAKTDWADARHLRELLLVGRLPESWIPPGHVLDLRARVRTRHLLSHQRTEWQQRMHSVLYHHGCPQRSNLLSLENRDWIAGLKLPAAAREQLDISLQIIDAIDIQLVPFDRELRTIARKQPGARALIDQIYGVGGLTAVTIIAELGDTRRFHNSRDVVRYAGLDITVYQSDQRRSPGHLSRQGPATLRWALYEAAQRARFPASPDRGYYLQLAERIGGNRACLALARKLLKRSSSKPWATKRSRPSPEPVTRQARNQPMNRGQLPARLLPTRPGGDGLQRLSGRNTICRNTPSNIMPPTRSQPGPSAEVSLGVRGHTPAPQRAHAPPTTPSRNRRPTRLTPPAETSKQQREPGRNG
jgi:transposase